MESHLATRQTDHSRGPLTVAASKQVVSKAVGARRHVSTMVDKVLIAHWFMLANLVSYFFFHLFLLVRG